MNDILKAHYQKITSKGGKAVKNKYGKKHFQQLQKKSVAARKRKSGDN